MTESSFSLSLVARSGSTTPCSLLEATTSRLILLLLCFLQLSSFVAPAICSLHLLPPISNPRIYKIDNCTKNAIQLSLLRLPCPLGQDLRSSSLPSCLRPNKALPSPSAGLAKLKHSFLSCFPPPISPTNSVSTRLNRPLTLLAITLPPKLSYYATQHASPCLLRAYTLMLNTFSHPILIILISSTVPYRNRDRTAAALLARSPFQPYRQIDTDSSNTFFP